MRQELRGYACEHREHDQSAVLHINEGHATRSDQCTLIEERCIKRVGPSRLFGHADPVAGGKAVEDVGVAVGQGAGAGDQYCPGLSEDGVLGP